MKIKALVNSATCMTVILSPVIPESVVVTPLTKTYFRTFESEISSQSVSCKVLSNFIYSNDFLNLYNKCKDVLPEQRYFSQEENLSYQQSINRIFKKTGKKISW